MSPRGNPKQRPGGKLPTSFHLTPELLQLLKEQAAALGVTQAAIVEIAVREYAARRPKPRQKEKSE